MSKQKVEGKKIFKMHASVDAVMVEINGKHSDIVTAFAHAIWNNSDLKEVLKDAFAACEARKNDENEDHPLKDLIEKLRKMKGEINDEIEKNKS